MYKFTEEIRTRLEPVLKQYVVFQEKAYFNGILTQTAIKQALITLVTQDVFTPMELTKEILQECNVLIPPNCINDIV
jgi:hypothetical protein